MKKYPFRIRTRISDFANCSTFIQCKIFMAWHIAVEWRSARSLRRGKSECTVRDEERLRVEPYRTPTASPTMMYLCSGLNPSGDS